MHIRQDPSCSLTNMTGDEHGLLEGRITPEASI